jgi:hypothetical protein
MRELKWELERRELPVLRNKYQRIKTLVDDDIAHREPPVIYNENSDPDGSLANAQAKRQEEYRIHDHSAVEAKEEYNKALLITLKVEIKTKLDKVKENAEIRKLQ